MSGISVYNQGVLQAQGMLGPGPTSSRSRSPRRPCWPGCTRSWPRRS